MFGAVLVFGELTHTHSPDIDSKMNVFFSAVAERFWVTKLGLFSSRCTAVIKLGQILFERLRLELHIHQNEVGKRESCYTTLPKVVKQTVSGSSQF